VPRPPMRVLYWKLNSKSTGPRKTLLLTLMAVIALEGSRGCIGETRDSWAREA
jgi:hypothetical protein